MSHLEPFGTCQIFASKADRFHFSIDTARLWPIFSQLRQADVNEIEELR